MCVLGKLLKIFQFWKYTPFSITYMFSKALIVDKNKIVLVQSNQSSPLGIHKQLNACLSIPRSRTVFIHFKMCRRSAEDGNNEAFCVVQCCRMYLFQPHILTNKHKRVTITNSSCIDFQLLLAALQKNTPGSILLGINQMPCNALMQGMCYYSIP